MKSLKSLCAQVGKLEKEIDRQEQYSRWNCLLIHDINENKNENTDDLVVETLNNNLDLISSSNNLDRTHHIGKSRVVNGESKSRPIIVKIASYIVCRKVYPSKKHLKGKEIAKKGKKKELTN